MKGITCTRTAVYKPTGFLVFVKIAANRYSTGKLCFYQSSIRVYLLLLVVWQAHMCHMVDKLM